VRLTTGTRKLAPRVHVPLKRLALCLDCEECFEIGAATCPACGSGTWTSLARFLEFASSKKMTATMAGTVGKGVRQDEPRHLLIVGRHRQMLYEHLKKAFADHDSVKVILERRTGDRRANRVPNVPERRGADRRASHARIDEQINTIGWSLVLLDLKKSARL
jgi:hypothetical protein